MTVKMSDGDKMAVVEAPTYIITSNKHGTREKSEKRRALLMVGLAVLGFIILSAIIVGIEMCDDIHRQVLKKQPDVEVSNLSKIFQSDKELVIDDNMDYLPQSMNDDQNVNNDNDDDDIHYNKRHRRRVDLPSPEDFKRMGMQCLNRCCKTVCACLVEVKPPSQPCTNMHIFATTGTCCKATNQLYCKEAYVFNVSTPTIDCNKTNVTIHQLAEVTDSTTLKTPTTAFSTLVSDTKPVSNITVGRSTTPDTTSIALSSSTAPTMQTDESPQTNIVSQPFDTKSPSLFISSPASEVSQPSSGPDSSDDSSGPSSSSSEDSSGPSRSSSDKSSGPSSSSSDESSGPSSSSSGESGGPSSSSRGDNSGPSSSISEDNSGLFSSSSDDSRGPSIYEPDASGPETNGSQESSL